MVNGSNYVDSVERGIAHVGAHFESQKSHESECLSYISSNTGDPEACKGELKRLAVTSSLLSWFSGRNLVQCKQQAYIAGKIDRLLYQNAPNRGVWGPLGERNAMVWPLLSDHPQLVAWFGAFDAIDVTRAAKDRSFEFETYQAKLALRGEWDKLGERSERFLANVPKRLERFAPDKRNDARLGDVENGQLSRDNYYRATLIDATVSVAAVGISGGAAGAVTTRLGTGIAGSAIAGGVAGGALDATVQAGQLSTYAATSGQPVAGACWRSPA